MTAFNKLGLSEEVLRVLEELGFANPTEIQKKAIPKLLGGDRDFIGIAQTGTGKTAAFGLPLIEQIDPNDKDTQAIVLAPTRELGKQIAEQLSIFSKYLFKLNVLAVYGGEAISKQLRALKKPQHIIIATPGRLIDLINRKAIKLKNIRFAVLDEADEMLNMGFKDELDEILSHTPQDKLTWLFSATMPKAIKKIVKNYMDEPLEVRINSSEKVNANISHQYVLTKAADKAESLTRFIDMYPDMRSVVFCRTRRDTQNLAEFLVKSNYKADAIHGDLSQQQRDRVMKRFKSKQIQLLVATDVAARGIDVNDLTHVFHYTLPDDTSYYTHRSGRTARAGKEGISIAFINGREGRRIQRLEKELSINFEKILIPSTEYILEQKVDHWVNKVYEKEISKQVKKGLLEKVVKQLKGLSKEELIGKMLMMELENSDLLDSRNLNDGLSIGLERDNDRDSRRGRRGKGGGGGRSNSKKKYGRFKKKKFGKGEFSFKGKKKKRKGGSKKKKSGGYPKKKS